MWMANKRRRLDLGDKKAELSAGKMPGVSGTGHVAAWPRVVVAGDPSRSSRMFLVDVTGRRTQDAWKVRVAISLGCLRRS